MRSIKSAIDAAIESGAIKPAELAAIIPPSGDLSSGDFVKNIAKAASEQVPKAKSTNSDALNYAKFRRLDEEDVRKMGMKKGGAVKKMKKGGTGSSASKRADGIAKTGKTKGRFV